MVFATQLMLWIEVGWVGKSCRIMFGTAVSNMSQAKPPRNQTGGMFLHLILYTHYLQSSCMCTYYSYSLKLTYFSVLLFCISPKEEANARWHHHKPCFGFSQSVNVDRSKCVLWHRGLKSWGQSWLIVQNGASRQQKIWGHVGMLGHGAVAVVCVTILQIFCEILNIQRLQLDFSCWQWSRHIKQRIQQTFCLRQTK